MFEFDLIHTLAFGGVALLVGYGLCRYVPLLGRYNLPPPVIGGLLVALAILIARQQGVTLFKFDTTLQSPLMIAFFTTIGFGASLSLLRVGGPAGVEVLSARDCLRGPAEPDRHPGGAAVRPGSAVRRAGRFGHAHRRSGDRSRFRPIVRTGRSDGAASIAVAVAMGGIVLGGIIGGPVSTYLIEKYRLRRRRGGDRDAQGRDDRRHGERWRRIRRRRR